MGFFRRSEFSAADKELRRQFEADRAADTLYLGRFLLIIGAPVLGYFIFQDTVILHQPIVLALRLTAVTAGILYTFFIFTRWARIPRYLMWAHSILLFSVMIMMAGSAFIIFSGNLFNQWHRSAVSSGVLVGMITVLLFSGGVRPYFVLIAETPLLVMVAALAAGGNLSFEDFSILTNPVFAGLIISVIAPVQENMRFQDFVRKTQALRQNRELEKLAGTDELTGMRNRRAGLAILANLLETASRTRTPLTVGFLDADRLKNVNDEFGHREGDYYLQTIARTIGEVMQPCDSAARMGGDEFIVMFPGRREKEAEKIIRNIDAGLRDASRTNPFPMAVSYGLAEYDPAGSAEARDLLRVADSRMYMNKQIKRRGAED